jgi:hypothetical protein
VKAIIELGIKKGVCSLKLSHDQIIHPLKRVRRAGENR